MLDMHPSGMVASAIVPCNRSNMYWQQLCPELFRHCFRTSKQIIYMYMYIYIIEGSLEVKLPTIWTDGKAEVGRVREEKRRREKIREEEESEERRCRCAER